MSESTYGGMADPPAASPADVDAQIASLRAAGADRFDPVRLRYLEALATRASAHRGAARRLLDARLNQAVAVFTERFEQARRDAEGAVDRGARQYPQAAGDLRRRLADGDFKGVRRLVAMLAGSGQAAALGALVRRLEQQSLEQADTGTAAHAADTPLPRHAGARTELRTIRNFRNTWSRLRVDKQVAQALEQAPRNAGPINSHMLVLRSLAMMRDISPDYLNQFMTYADTLLCLDQCGKDKPAPPKKPAGGRASKK